MSKKSIAIIYPQVGLDAIPSLMALIHAFADRGYVVHIYTCQDESFTFPQINKEAVQILVLPEKFYKSQSGWRWQFFLKWIPYVIKNSHSNGDSCLLGVDPWGLLLATIIGVVLRIPVVYFSLEIFQWKSVKSSYLKILKILERISNKGSKFTIIQDCDRANLLIHENRINRDQIEILPNAPQGSAYANHTNYLKRTLNISDKRPILLQIGNSYPVKLSIDFAREAKKWSTDWAVVFHARSINSYPNELINEIDNNNIFFSKIPVSSGDLRSVIESADVGLALYSDDLGDNLFYLGHSSGKIAHYLQAGLPVIGPNLPSVKKYIEDYNCGICINNVNEIRDGVSKILNNYSYYAENALVCFREQFDFERYFFPIFERFEKIINFD